MELEKIYIFKAEDEGDKSPYDNAIAVWAIKKITIEAPTLHSKAHFDITNMKDITHGITNVFSDIAQIIPGSKEAN